MLKALLEFIMFIVGLFKDSHDRQVAEQDKRDALLNSIPQTPKEKADDDVQKVQAAAVGSDTDALMREYERLRRASLGAAISTADTGAGGEDSRDPGGQGDRGTG